MVAFSEHGGKPSSFVQGVEFGQLINYQLPKNTVQFK
jgi:hypothetical protein